MSSEKINITRLNYEEYFLLYVDNELSPAERMAVENFISVHPDLREELDILLQTSVLEVSSTSLGDKSFLMADSMKLNVMDDELLLYVDNELSKEETSKVEKRLKSDKDYRFQHDLLRRTKLPQEKIIYPYKAELYRRTERAIGGYWLRVAAAVVIIAAITLVYFLNDNSSATVQPVVATVDKNKNETLVQPDHQQVAVLPAEEKMAPVENRNPKTDKGLSVPVSDQILPQENDEQIAYDQVEIPSETIRANTDPVVRTEPAVIEAGNGGQQNINTGTVTETAGGASTNIQGSVTTAPDYAVTDEKGTSVKGLLRKATRFIEKRTGVNPVNDDDELLIGVVAIKLK